MKEEFNDWQRYLLSSGYSDADVRLLPGFSYAVNFASGLAMDTALLHKAVTEQLFNIKKERLLMAVANFDRTNQSQAKFVWSFFFLSLLYRGDMLESILGDLHEEMNSLIIPKIGIRKAKFWFNWHISLLILRGIWTKMLFSTFCLLLAKILNR